MQRIGVFVCHCGTNIAGTVDVKAVAAALRNEPGVVVAEDYQYMCSQAGQDLIKKAIRENNLNGVVICSCSPRMHEATFRKTAASAGLNPYMVEIANIREQCSWVHKDMPTGTEKAIILGKAAVAVAHVLVFGGRRRKFQHILLPLVNHRDLAAVCTGIHFVSLRKVCKINDLHLFTPVPFSNIFHGDTTPALG